MSGSLPPSAPFSSFFFLFFLFFLLFLFINCPKKKGHNTRQHNEDDPSDKQGGETKGWGIYKYNTCGVCGV